MILHSVSFLMGLAAGLTVSIAVYLFWEYSSSVSEKEKEKMIKQLSDYIDRKESETVKPKKKWKYGYGLE